MWFWQKNWGHYPHPLILGQPPSWKICCVMLELDSLKQWWQAQVGQLFSMGDVQWERAWPWTRLEMPHSYSQEQVHGLENQPTLLQTPWQSRRAIAQAVSDHRVKARGPGCPCMNLPAQQPFWFDPPRSSPLKDVPGDGGSDHQPSPLQPSSIQEHNRHWRDQRPQSHQFPSPSQHHGFESNWSSLSMASSMSSRSDRWDGSQHPKRGRHHWGEGAHMKRNLLVFKDKDAKDAVTYQSWRWDLMVYQCAGCRDNTPLPYAIRSLQGFQRVGTELQYKYNLGWCVDNLGWTL